jgi:hypothetical protein
MLKAAEAPTGIQSQTESKDPPDTLMRLMSQVVDEEPFQSSLPVPGWGRKVPQLSVPIR